jgi:hypothetical protein
MTQAEYTKAYAKARRSVFNLTRRVMKELEKVYITAGDQVAAIVRDAELRDLSPLTINSRTAIQLQLEAGANNIRSHLANNLPKSIRDSSNIVSRIDKKYMTELLPFGRGVDAAGIAAVTEIVNEKVVISVINRVFTDGYSFSDRIWLVGTDYRTNINRVISAGYAQGRDPVKIAKDIQVYIEDGKIKLAKRYGPNLKAGTKRFLQRVRLKIDYRALRLVRSELYMGLQDAGRESGRANPGGLGLYDWILNPNRQQWNCVCPDNAAGSPYAYNEVPSFAHPNDMCRVQVRLRRQDDFLKDLKKWGNEEDVGYLDSWYREYYVPGQSVRIAA